VAGLTVRCGPGVRRFAAALGWVALAAAPSLGAQAADPHTAQPERPTVATHAGTVAPGWFELESGAEFDHAGGGGYDVALPLFLKFGLARRVQLGLALPFSAPLGGGIGPGDFGFFLKWRLRDGAGLPGRLAILPGLKLPTGSASAGRGTGTTDASLLLISSHQLGSVELDLNAGITRRSGDGTQAPRTATVWTASFGGPASGSIGWVAEMYGYPKTTGPAGSAGIVALLAGPTLTVRPWLVLDAGGTVALTGPQPTAFFFGITWNGGRFSRQLAGS
jgi:hypothetical protein